MAPRIAFEDLLSNDQVADLVGEWVRNPLYRDGHVVSADPTHALCGRAVVLTPEEYRPLQHAFSKEDWWLARDVRQSSKCSECRRKLPDLWRQRAQQRPDPPPLPAEPIDRLRRLQRYAWVKKLLGATEVN